MKRRMILERNPAANQAGNRSVDTMLKSVLKQLSHDSAHPGQLVWSDIMQGVRACSFSCEFSSGFFPSNQFPMHFEILFCRYGKLLIYWQDGQTTSLEEREILLLADLLQVQSIQWVHPEMQGILVAVDALQAKKSFTEVCSLIGSAPLNTSKVKTVMEGQRGCAVIPQNSWNDVVFDAIEKLPPTEQGRYCTFLSVELLYLLCSDAYSLPWKSISTYFDKLYVDRVQQAHEYLLANLNKSVTIGELSQRFHLSPTTLKNCFHQIYGKPIRKYMQECRVRQAAELLLTTSESVIKIAHSVGYESASQFGMIFRRHFQMSPAEYRKKMSNSDDVRPNPDSHSAENTI